MPVHRNTQSRREVLAQLGLGTVGLCVFGPRAVVAAPKERGSNPSMTFQNAQLVMPNGEVKTGGIRIESGKIVDLGTRIRSGVDLNGAWVSPGFVDAGCTLGLVEIGLEDGSKDDSVKGAVAPDARVWDGYNPASSVIPVTRVEGVTHALVHPSPRQLVSGQAALFATVGDTVQNARAATEPVLCINMGRSGQGGNGGPSSRMGVSMELRKRLDDATKLMKERDQAKKSKKKEEAKELDQAQQVWLKIRTGQQRVLIKAERADDILKAMDFAAAYELDAILLGAAEGHRVAREIADAKIPVFLGPLTVQPSSFEHLQARYDNAQQLHEAGVRLAFRTGSAHGSRNLRVSAGVAVAHGLPWEAAMNSLSHGAWSALGGPKKAGKLEFGAPAHLVFTGGDPLQPRSAVLRVIIDGVETSMMTRQRRLYERFKVLGERIR